MKQARYCKLCVLVVFATCSNGVPVRINDGNVPVPRGNNVNLKTLDSSVISEVLEAIISNIGGNKRIDRIKSIDKSFLSDRSKSNTNVLSGTENKSSKLLESFRKNIMGIIKPTFKTVTVATTSKTKNRRRLMAERAAVTSTSTSAMSPTSTDVTSSTTPRMTKSTTTNTPTTKASTPVTSTRAPPDKNQTLKDKRKQACSLLGPGPLPFGCGSRFDMWS